MSRKPKVGTTVPPVAAPVRSANREPQMTDAEIMQWARSDPYFGLRAVPVAIDKVCACVPDPPILLRTPERNSPLYCVLCGHEARLEDLHLEDELILSLCDYAEVAKGLYEAWLFNVRRGGPIEYTAKTVPWGTLNVHVDHLGREIVERLNVHRRSYYWGPLTGNGLVGRRRRTACPQCKGTLEPHVFRDTQYLICEGCSLVMFPT